MLFMALSAETDKVIEDLHGLIVICLMDSYHGLGAAASAAVAIALEGLLPQSAGSASLAIHPASKTPQRCRQDL